MIAEIKLLRIMEDSPLDSCVTPDEAVAAWRAHVVPSAWFHDNKEHLIVLTLDTKLKLTGYHLVSLGSLNECIAHPRPVLVAGAFALIIMHNHPSGDPTPSEADRRLTNRVREACAIMDVRLLDHVIVGDKGQRFSFKESGLL